MDYQKIEAKHPELRGLDPFSAEWYRAFRTAHLAMYPDCDAVSRDNLNDFVAEAEARETK